MCCLAAYKNTHDPVKQQDAWTKLENQYRTLNLEDSVNLIKRLKPKKAILTNLHVDLDYFKLKKKLPKNILPAYDGLKINF